MYKKFLFAVVLFLCASVAFSRHLKGGWIYYDYLGAGSAPNTTKYRITVNQYLLCTSEGGQIDEQVYVGFFDARTNFLDTVVTINHTDYRYEDKTNYDACISNPPSLCYRIDTYVTIIDLPDIDAGYILGVQRCCRIENIVNLVSSQDAGITYSITIPGVVDGKVVRNNNSPLFRPNDLSVICINSPFTLNFSATDSKDNDSLVYSFCSGLIGGDNSNTPQGNQPNPPSNPPFRTLTYAAPYSGTSPLGALVTIDSKTGIISGTAPPKAGDYVIAVCITEYRNGSAIANTRKEIHFTVANCQLTGAQLKPSYATCEGLVYTFANESLASNINDYTWTFGFKDTMSNEPTPTVTFPKPGQYNIKLVVRNSQGCVDSANTVLNVFPGFDANFSVTGSCLENAYLFTDSSTTAYGNVDSWHWDFGDQSTFADTSNVQNPPGYLYSQVGTMMAKLIVTNTKGCADTITKEVSVFEKPVVALPFRDTLICRNDELQLSATTGNAATNFTWTPVINIRNENSNNPIVYPRNTITYYVKADDGNGCENTDSVKVNVIDEVSLSIGNDTLICLTDTVQLQPVTNGLFFRWSPSATLSDSTVANPYATPLATTTYHLQSGIGGCLAEDDITILYNALPRSQCRFG